MLMHEKPCVIPILFIGGRSYITSIKELSGLRSFLPNSFIIVIYYLWPTYCPLLPDRSFGNGRIDHLMIYLIDITDIDKICD